MKSYFAGSVQLAMEQARRELGSDAILVTSRVAPMEAGKPRQYEVVFATDTPEKAAVKESRPASVSEAPKPAARGALTPDSIEAVLGEIKGMRQQIEALMPRPGFANERTASVSFGNAERQMLAQLTSADVDPDLAQQLLAAALQRLASRPPKELETKEGRFAEVLRAVASKRETTSTDLRAALAASIKTVVRVETGLDDNAKPQAIALIGPPGAGKTSAIVKLAIRCGVSQGRPTLLLSADDTRVAASEQLRRYAAVLGLRFESALSLRALGQLLEDHRNSGLILIDTPGCSLRDLSEVNPLARFLSSHTEIQKHLVLPAGARGGDIDRICSAFETFGPTHLFFSRIDETTVFGPVLNEAMGRGLPLSFFSTGSEIPEGLAEANAELIADRLLPESTNSRTLGAAA